MTDYSVVIDLILNGLGDVDTLGKALSKLRRSAKDAETAGTSLEKVDTGAKKAKEGLEGLGAEIDKGRSSSIAYARALASLQTSQGQLKAASQTLSDALRREQEDTTATIRAKQQLAGIEAKLGASQSKGASELSKNSGVAAAELRKVETQTLNAAKAQAALKSAQGDQAGAALILRNALAKVTQETTAVTAAKRQLASTEAQLTTASSKQQAAMLKEAQLLARIRQLKGDQAGGASILKDALAKVDPSSLNALRAQIQQIYFDTDYKNSPLIGSIRGLGQGLAQLTPFFGRAGTAVGTFTGQANQAAGAAESIGAGAALSIPVVGTLVATLLGMAAVIGVLDAVAEGIVAIGERGIETNKTLETMRFGVAAVIAGTSEISKNGVPVEGAAKFAASFALAGEQIEKITEEALKLGLPVQETVDGFQRALGPLGRMKVNLDDARKVTLGIVVAMRDIGIPLAEIGQETRGLLQGDTSRQSRLNNQLGISKAQLAVWKEQGTVAEEILKRLEDYTLAGEAFRKSFEGGLVASQAALNNFAAKVSLSLFETLRDKMATVFDNIDAAGGLEKAFEGVSETLKNIFETASGDASDLIDFLLHALTEIDEFLADNQSTITEIVSGIDQLLRLTGLLLSDILGIDQLNDGQAPKLKLINSIIKVMVALWGIVSEGIGVVVQSIKIVGNVLLNGVLVVLAAIGKAISQLLAPFSSVSDTAASISNSLSNLAFTGLANTAKQAFDLGNNVLNFGKRTSQALVDIDTAEARLETRRTARLTERKKKNDTSGLGTKGKPTPEKEEKGKTAKAAKDNAEVVIKAEEGLEKALLALRTAFFERGQQAAKNNLETETTQLELALEDRLIGLSDFFTKKRALIDESTRLELEAVGRQIEAERARYAEIEAGAAKQEDAARKEEQRQLKAAKNDSQRSQIKTNTLQKIEAIGIEAEKERLDVDTKIIKLQQEVDKAEAAGLQKTADAARKRLEMYRELVNQLRSAGNELNELTGNKLQAALDGIDQRFEQLLQKTKLEFGATSKQVELLIALINKLKQNAGLDDQLTKLRNAQSITQSTLDLKRSDVEERQLQGLITERQARREILELQRQYVAAVLPALEAEIKATRALGSEHEAEAKQLEAKAAALRQLTIDTDALNLRISRALEDGLLDVLQQIGDQIKSIQDFAIAMANVFLREMKKIAAEHIVDQLFGSKKTADGQEKKGPVPALIDKVISIFTGKKGEGGANVAGALTGAAVPQTEIQATQANTDALLALTQALTGAGGLFGGKTGASSGGPGGGLLGAIITGGLGLLGGLFKPKGGDSFDPGAETIVLGPTTPGPDDDPTATGTAGNILGAATNALTGQGPGGLAGGAKNLLDAMNANTTALYEVVKAVTGMVGTGQGGAAGADDGGFSWGGLLSAGLSIGGAIAGAFGGGGGSGDSFGDAPTTVLGPTTSDGGFGGGGDGLLSGILGSFLGGGASAGKATNVLDGINQILVVLAKIESNTQQQGGGGMGGGGFAQFLPLLAGLDEGGWTGPGPISKAAGIVHGKEFVFSAPAVDNLGLGYLENLHHAARHGFADGGFVAPHDMAMPTNAGATAQPVINIRPVNVFDPKDIAAAMVSSTGETALLNFITSRAPEIRARLKVGGGR